MFTYRSPLGGINRLTRRSTFFGILVVVSLLSGCWLQVGFGSAHQAYNPLENKITTGNVDTLSAAWTVDYGNSYISRPVIAGSRMYFLQRPAGLATLPLQARSLDIRSGTVVWEQDLIYGMIDTLYFRDPVFSGEKYDELWAVYNTRQRYGGEGEPAPRYYLSRIDPSDGTIIDIQEDENIALLGPPTTGSDVIAYVVGRYLDGHQTFDLEVHDQTTRELLWSSSIEVGSSYPAYTAISSGQLYLGMGDRLYSFNSQGCGSTICEPQWSTTVPETVTTLAVGINERVVVGASPEGISDDVPQVAVYDGSSGTLLWYDTFPDSASGLRQHPQIAVAEENVYVAVDGPDHGLGVYSIDGCSESPCDPEWTVPLNGGRGGLAPIVGGDVLFVGVGGDLQAYPADGCGASTCVPLWVSDSCCGYQIPLAVTNGRLYVHHSFGGYGSLVAYTPDDI